MSIDDSQRSELERLAIDVVSTSYEVTGSSNFDIEKSETAMEKLRVALGIKTHKQRAHEPIIDKLQSINNNKSVLQRLAKVKSGLLCYVSDSDLSHESVAVVVDYDFSQERFICMSGFRWNNANALTKEEISTFIEAAKQ